MTEPVLPHVAARMRSTRGRDTEPELQVRKILHARGWRYRVNSRPEPDIRRTGDLVFTRRRIVVLIDGCFWHGCQTHFVLPKTRTEWWAAKIAANRRRDAETTQLWSDRGWLVLRFWEHQPSAEVAAQIEAALKRA